jgi:outer membrane usher protein
VSTWIRALVLIVVVTTSATAHAARSGNSSGAKPKALKAAAAEELWLAVAVNGQLTGTTALVRYDHDGNLWVSEDELKNWRLTLPAEADNSLPGTPLYSLKAYPGLTFRVDEAAQTLTVDAPAKLFDSVELTGRESGHVAAAPTPPGGFFNYDLVGTRNSDGNGASALFEAGTFGRFGTGVTRFLERRMSATQSSSTPTSGQSVRLDSTWTLDRPDSLTSIRIGDSITGASHWWGGAVRFGGVQWGTNFATQPNLVTMPLPSIAGESALPSTLELYVNNALRMSQNVPEGPFNVRDIPIVSGDGQIRVVVRDLLGREQVITQSYYSSPTLLRAGLHDYSIEAGAVRNNFGLASNDYGRALVTATDRYGFSDRFTGEIHTELLESQQTLGIAGGWLFEGIGMLSAAIAGSNSDVGHGQLVSLGFERTAARFSIGMNAELASEQFTRVGLLEGERVPRLKTQLFANLALGKLGSVSVLSARQAYWTGEVTQLTSVRHSVDIRGFAYLNLTALRTSGANHDTSFGLSLSRSLGNRTNGNVSLSSDHNGVSALAQMQKGLPPGTGLGYRVRALSGATDGAEGTVSYQNDVGTYSLEARQVNQSTETTASITGGVAVMGAGLFASRRIDSSFAIARVGDEADVRVYRDNQLVGRTNASGYAILPGLRAYEDNRISIEQADLPLDVAIGSLSMQAVPAFRSGMLLDFPIERSRGALLTVMLENGEPLPSLAVVQIVGQEETFPTGLHGEVYISQMADQNRFRATWQGGACEFDAAYTPSADPVPRLGPFECRAVSH